MIKIVGLLLTVTSLLAVALHPLSSVTSTEYVVVLFGNTVIELVVAPPGVQTILIGAAPPVI